MIYRAILDQLARGHSITFAPVSNFPDWVSVTLTDSNGNSTEEAVCEATELHIRGLIRKLEAKLESE